MKDERCYRRDLDKVIVKNAAVASFIFHLSSLSNCWIRRRIRLVIIPLHVRVGEEIAVALKVGIVGARTTETTAIIQL